MVGRDALMQQILAQRSDEAAMGELIGVLGVGKTYLLERMGAAIRSKQMLPILMTVDDFDPGHHGEVGEKASVGAVQASFHRYRRLLAALLAKVAPQGVCEQFEAAVADAYNADVLGRRVFSLEDSVNELSKELNPSDLAEAWREAANAVTQLFLDRWNNTAGDQVRLLLLDNVDAVADQELGVWLGRLLPRLQRTVTVTTREPGGVPVPLGSPWRTFPISNLDLDEVQAYLARRVSGGGVPESVVRRIWEVTEGHPATLVIVQRLIWGSDGTAHQDVQEVLTNAKGPQNERVAILVERLLTCAGDELLRRAVWAAAIPRSVSPGLLRFLLAEDAGSEDELKRVVGDLEGLPFVEKPWGELGSFRLHPFVRNSLVARMARLEGDRFTTLHAQCVEYYRTRLLGEQGTAGEQDNDLATSYGDAFTYEDPQWQARKREWLYHSGFASKERRRSVLVDFAGVFFDAFWWWGNYVHFDFCDQLLADLGHLAAQRDQPRPNGDQLLPQVDPEDQSWRELQKLHDALQTFLKEYPLRSVKPWDADWGAVEESLRSIKAFCELPAAPDVDASADDRHLAALVNVFLAHARRYGQGRQAAITKRAAKADDYYQNAASFFEGNDEWSPNWVSWERADMAFERGHDDAVAGLWASAADNVQPLKRLPAADVDYELTSNLHRLRGDCAWRAGDRLRAAQWYGRAVLHAYLFHFGGRPLQAAPDLYTLQFYVDIRARAINRLRELVKDGDLDAALRCALEMSHQVRDALGEDGVDDPEKLRGLLADGAALPIALALFPRGPDVAELERNSDTGFVRDFRRRYEELELPELLRDLHDPSWP